MSADAQAVVNAAKGNAANSTDFNQWLDTLPPKLVPALTDLETLVQKTLIPPIENAIIEYNKNYTTVMSTQSDYTSSLLDQTFHDITSKIEIDKLSAQYQAEIAKVFESIFPFDLETPTVDRHGKYTWVTWPSGKTQTIFSDYSHNGKVIQSELEALANVAPSRARSLANIQGLSWTGLSTELPNDKSEIYNIIQETYLINVYPYLLGSVNEPGSCQSKLCILQKVKYIRETMMNLASKLIKSYSFTTVDGKTLTLSAPQQYIFREVDGPGDYDWTPAFQSFETLYSLLISVDPNPFLKDLPLDVPTAKP
jgi:hypothetical protein